MDDLKTTLPSLASDLPFDLLARIFAFNIGELISRRGLMYINPEYRIENRTSTRSASHVCRNWRNSALACPFLWNSMIDFGAFHPDWIRVLLERCKDVPLVVKISGTPPYDESKIYSPQEEDLDALVAQNSPRHYVPPAGWAILFDNLDQVRKLDVSFLDWYDAEPGMIFILDKLGRNPARSLEKLYMVAFIYEDEEDDSNIPILPPSILAGIAPRLRRLELGNIILGPNLPYGLFCNLVSLSITFYCVPHATPTSQWLQLLSVTPLLEKLNIKESQPAATRLISSPVQRVRLNNLVKFNIFKDLGDCVDLLSNLDTPPACSFTIGCAGTRPGREYHAMHSILLRRLSSTPQEMPTNTIEFHSHPQRFSFGSRPDSAFEFWISFKTEIDGLDLTSTNNGFDPPLISLLALFSRASTLHLESHGGQLLIEALRLFEEVTTLYADDTMEDLLSVLWESAPSINQNFLLPALVRIKYGSKFLGKIHKRQKMFR